MPSAELFILDTRARKIIPAEQITPQYRIDEMERMLEEVRLQEHGVMLMKHDIMMDGIRFATRRRQLLNEIAEARHQVWLERRT